MNIQENFDNFFNKFVDQQVQKDSYGYRRKTRPQNVVSHFFKSLLEPFDLGHEIKKGIDAYNFRAVIFNIVTGVAMASTTIAVCFAVAILFEPAFIVPALSFLILSVAMMALRELIDNNIKKTITGNLVEISESSQVFRKLIPTNV